MSDYGHRGVHLRDALGAASWGERQAQGGLHEARALIAAVQLSGGMPTEAPPTLNVST